MELKSTTETPVKHTNEGLYYRQVEMLKAFRKRNAISQEEFDKCYCDLTEKMRIESNRKKMLE